MVGGAAELFRQCTTGPDFDDSVPNPDHLVRCRNVWESFLAECAVGAPTGWFSGSVVRPGNMRLRSVGLLGHPMKADHGRSE